MATRTPTTGIAHLTVVPENFGDESEEAESGEESGGAVIDRSAEAGSRD